MDRVDFAFYAYSVLGSLPNHNRTGETMTDGLRKFLSKLNKSTDAGEEHYEYGRFCRPTCYGEVMAGKDTDEMTEADILKWGGWSTLCESPHEIEHEQTQSTATGYGVVLVVDALRAQYQSEKETE